MRPEYLSVEELGTGLVESRLALLVRPLLTPGDPDPTPDFAREFADAFNIIFFQEGNPVFDFISNLKEWEKVKIINLLIRGGMAGSTYISGDIYFLIPTDVQLDSPNNSQT